VWWANYTATRPTNYQMLWGEFREAFRAHHIPVGVMRRKRQEFMDLKQGRRSVHEYSKLFNHLVQYAPEQDDTDDKKKDRFINGLSTKLQERLALSMGVSHTSSATLSSRMIRSAHIRKVRRGRSWQPHLEVPRQSTGWCTILLAPPTSRTSTSSGLPAHLSVRTSRQHQRLYHHHRL
jgi:hypothetical protein